MPFDLCEALKPSSLVSLGEGIGKVAAAIVGGEVSKIDIKTHGKDLKSHSYLPAAVCMGLLSKANINLINSMVNAKDIGIEVSIACVVVCKSQANSLYYARCTSFA